MNDFKPEVAVLIPFYGSVSSLRKSLFSLGHEELAHDVVVVDDGNPSLLRIPSDWHPSVTVLRHEQNRGITAALNSGIEHIKNANYRYLARLDAGDCSVSGRLKKQVAFLEKNPDCMMVGGDADCVSADGRLLFTVIPPSTGNEILRALHRQCCIIHPTVMFRTEVLAEVGGYSEMYPAAEDYDLFFRIASKFSTANIPETVVRYEDSGRPSISAKRRRTQVRSRLRIVLAHFDPLLAESYQGVAESIVCMILPRWATVSLHELRAHLKRSLPAKRILRSFK
jgi:glycosyltransferase involved in cell wall biosynthesis